jgi:hypothetical protein
MVPRLHPLRRLVLSLFLAMIATGPSLSGLLPAPAGQIPPPASLSAEDWARDLDFLASELPARHKNLFAGISADDFCGRIESLKNDLALLQPDQILVRLMAVVAAVGDSHTTLGYRTQRGIPLMTAWLKDGIHVLNTTETYAAILHGRITAIGDRPLEEIIPRLAAIIPHENEAQVRNQLPNLLVDTAILHGLGLIPSPESAALTVETAGGERLTVAMLPLVFTSNPAWIVDTADESGAPLYLRNRRLSYWFEILTEAKTLFFKYNACREMPGKPFAAFTREMFEAADGAGVERVVVDLRHNGGGNSAIFRPFLEELKKRPALMQKERVFVLVGRRTFSSAVLNALEMKKETPAVFAGEPTGGKPNHFGEVQMFQLPCSKLPVTYSVKYFKVIEDDPESLVPEILVEPTLRDYLDKADPVLDTVLKK